MGMGTVTGTATKSFTNADIENVVRRFTADILMIAQSTGAVSEAKAREYAADVETLAKKGYLSAVDLTLFSGGYSGNEERAVKYTVSTNAGDLTSSRPGGTRWPRVNDPYLRIILSYTSSYNDAAREALKPTLNIQWTPTNADTTHSRLNQSGGRDYASNGWGMQRKDFSN
jgi:hypothetical protein